MIVCWPGTLEPGSLSARLVSFVDFGPTVLSVAGAGIPERMQGPPFLGPMEGPPRRYVFVARDRIDETYDRIRAVRDNRFEYIWNYQPEKPYAQHLGYMDQMPTMREWRRLHAEGRVKGPQRFFFQAKPRRELYDTVADPHEVHDLAGKPEHAATLRRLRGALTDWVRAYGDLGEVHEFAMLRGMRPGGRYERTGPVRIHQAASGSGEGRVRIRLECPTPGASIGYTTDSGPDARWLLYSAEAEFSKPCQLLAKAIRYGFLESPESVTELD